MFTMIIADDETIARKSQELFIKTEFPEIEVIASVGSGARLIELVSRLKPDLAIVDINMPGIDGIQAIKMLKGSGSRTHFMINTAYSEFEYAQNALSMQVDAYIVKPGIREETIAAIRKVCGCIRKEKEESRKNNGMHTFLQSFSPILETEILLSLCSGICPEQEFESYCAVSKIEFCGGSIVTLILLNSEGESGGINIDKPHLRCVIEAALSGLCRSMLLITETAITMFLLLPRRKSAGEDLKWIKNAAELAAESLREKTGIQCRIGVGGLYGDISLLSASYYESLRALKEDAGAGAGKEWWQKSSDEKAAGYVEQALHYISEHYREDISLDGMAASIGISPFYLSRLIKTKKHVTFVEYLTQLRVNRAKELAEQGELTNREIAEVCGFSNVTYFYKVFKKAAGQTLGEYRGERQKAAGRGVSHCTDQNEQTNFRP